MQLEYLFSNHNLWWKIIHKKACEILALLIVVVGHHRWSKNRFSEATYGSVTTHLLNKH